MIRAPMPSKKTGTGQKRTTHLVFIQSNHHVFVRGKHQHFALEHDELALALVRRVVRLASSLWSEKITTKTQSQAAYGNSGAVCI
jgi:hypothetical protein